MGAEYDRNLRIKMRLESGVIYRGPIGAPMRDCLSIVIKVEVDGKPAHMINMADFTDRPKNEKIIDTMKYAFNRIGRELKHGKSEWGSQWEQSSSNAGESEERAPTESESSGRDGNDDVKDS